MNNNTRGQIYIFYVVFVAILFCIMLAFFIAPFVTEWSFFATTSGELTGIEAFFMNNLLLWIILAFIIWILYATYRGRNG